MYINQKKNKRYLLILAIAFSFNAYSQNEAKLYKKHEIDSAFLNYSYSMIICNLDTFYCKSLIEGRHLPKFNKKISGLYVEMNKGETLLKSYVVNGKLTGYYVYYKNDVVFEDGYFDFNGRRILKRW